MEARKVGVLLSAILFGALVTACDSPNRLSLRKAVEHIEQVGAPAAKEMLPAMLELYAPYCPTCREMAPLMKNLTDLCDKKLVRLETVDVSAEENERLLEQYRIQSLPTFLFLDESGTEVERLVGRQTKTSLERALFDLRGEHCAALRGRRG